MGITVADEPAFTKSHVTITPPPSSTSSSSSS
jgi:hypothetical protein